MADKRTGSARGTRPASARRDGILLGVAAAGLLVVGIVFALLQTRQVANPVLAAQLRELTRSALAIGSTAERAAAGLQPDFAVLSTAAQNIDGLLPGVIAAAPASARSEADAAAAAWSGLGGAIDAIRIGSEPYQRVAEAMRYVGTAIHASDNPAADGGLARNVAVLIEKIAARPAASAALLSAASQQAVALERLHALAGGLLGRGANFKAAVADLDAQIRVLQSNNDSLLADPALASSVQLLKEDVKGLAQAAQVTSQQAEPVAALLTAAAGTPAAIVNLTSTLAALDDKAGSVRDGLPTWLPWIAYLAGLLSLGAIALFVRLRQQAAAEAARLAAEKETRQQQAILHLLDEITNLADGDLTVDVTVTEDFTGAIADSINYTVQTLRGLVGTINRTSEDIVGAAASTQGTALKMSEASERQAQEITATSTAITATSESLRAVAARAENISLEAEGSVQIAHNGANTVGRTIQNMAALREQIQDTAKRIKRLGESSQEIGNIIEVINDIAEQTNTLALNASIQAAMAGEAGRGFSVVAHEVQRLAERAGSATRQIETLVKTIQADTNEAIISMERSTANVVSGAQSAEEAGQALTRIEASSQELARSIQDIAIAARGESQAATRIADTMLSIRQIAMQTSESAGLTSQAVGELNALSDKLRESVSGFKLADDNEAGAVAAPI